MSLQTGCCTPKRQIVAPLVTIISPIINIVLILILAKVIPLSHQDPTTLQKGMPATHRYKSWPTWLAGISPDLKDYDPVKLDSLTTFKGRLSHVLFSMRDTEEDLENLRASFDFWRRYPPCLEDSYPTNHSRSEIDLIFYFDSLPGRAILREIGKQFNTLPANVQSCFREMEIRHAGIKRLKDPTPQEEREQWRQVFETLVTNQAGLKAPNHVLILSTECRPVQPDWLNHVDYTVRPPVESGWMRGSIFQGRTKNLPHDIGQLIRLSPSALYNFADAAFAEFYMTRVRPWTLTTQSPIIPEFGDRWSVDIFQYLTKYDISFDWFAVTHQFHHANFIADYHGTKVPLEQFQLYNPDTFIVCGELV